MINNNIYQQITDKIINELHNNKVIWNSGFSIDFIPLNYYTKKRYKGINIFLLLLEKQINKYKYNYWLSFNQVKHLKGYVNKDSKATPIIYFDYIETEKEVYNNDTQQNEINKRFIPFVKTHYVFNIQQTDLKIDDTKTDIKPITEVEDFINNYTEKPLIVNKFNGYCYYNRNDDFINMVNMEHFKDINHYYSHLLHEIIHSTGHKKRLNRFKDADSLIFGNTEYSKEELIAEIGNCFLSNIIGLKSDNTFKNNVAYINGWLKALKEDNKLFFNATTKAQRSVDFILNNMNKNYMIDLDNKKIEVIQ